MSEQVNYRQQWAEGEIEAGTLLDAIDSLQYANFQLAQNFGVAHAEAEALRAENGRLRPLAEDRDQQYDMKVKARQQRDEMRTELEAARGLLRDAIDEIDYMSGASHACKGVDRSAAEAFITATPAPEVQNHTERNLEMAEQGYRQEAVARVGMVPGTDFKSLDFFNTDLQELPVGTMLYTTPQPGPDVRGLVKALEHYSGCGKSGNVARVALSAHRQAQQGGSNEAEQETAR